MATALEDALERIQVVGAKLAELAANRDTSHVQLAATLSEYRRACTSYLHSNYLEASRSGVEEKLWEGHGQINTRYRKDMQELKKRRQNAAVEIRKHGKSYLDYLKSSQRFYRAYICDLDAQHGGTAELRKVARQLEPEQAAAGSSSNHIPDSDTRKALVKSAYLSLNHLGDLSRYRETECSPNPPKWGPAVGYYNLAIEIHPHSGLSYNQLAVIALADSNHFRAMYYLYRSLTVREPHPLARQNLQLEFRKIAAAWEKGELIRQENPRDANTGNKALVAWFVRLHSKCDTGEEFPGHHELEDEVLGQLAQASKQRSVDILLHRMVLINVSAQWITAQKARDNQTSSKVSTALLFYLQLNIRTFTTLLQVLLEEFEHSPGSANADKPSEPGDKITAIARRVLPAVRLYSHWLTENADELSSSLEPSFTQHKDEMWRVYAEVLSRGVATFLNQGLIEADYLLEEDSDIIGFVPLVDGRTRDQWYTNGELRFRFSDENVQRHHPAKEALVRIKDMVHGAAKLITEDRAPLVYENFRFTYRPDYELAKSFTAEKIVHTVVEPVQEPPRRAIPPASGKSRQRAISTTTSLSSSVTKDVSMNRMVDALVDEDDGLDGLPAEANLLPTTPPTNYDNVPMGRSLSSATTHLPVMDVVQQVPDWSQPKGSASQKLAMSPFVKNAPSPLQQPDPWFRPTGSGPSSPFQVGASYSTRSPTTGAVQTLQPLHSRGPSTSSFQAQKPEFYSTNGSNSRPSTAHTITPTFPRTNELEELRDVWGVTPNVPTAEWVRMRQPRYKEQEAEPMTSSMLFGPGGAPWSTAPVESRASHADRGG